MKKINFYEGMTPTPQTFQDLQDNIENNINSNLTNTTGIGVLDGLVCTINNGNLEITPGVATIPSGKQLKIASLVKIAISDSTNGIVLLSNTVTDTAQVSDIAGNAVWQAREDVSSIHIEATQQADDIILGTIQDGKYNPTGRQIALAWATLKEYIDTSIATAKAEAKTEALDEALPVGITYLQGPHDPAPKAGTYTYYSQDDIDYTVDPPVKTNPKTITFTEDESLTWPKIWEWEIDSFVSDTGIRFMGADNAIALKQNKSEADIPNDKGAIPFKGQTKPQPDSGRNIKGTIRTLSVDTGVFFEDPDNIWRGQVTDGYGGHYGVHRTTMLASRSYGISHTAAEFRDQNYTWIKWRRIS